MSGENARKLVDASLDDGWFAPEPAVDAAVLDPLDVERTAYEMRVRDAARRKVARMSGLVRQPPAVVDLADFLAVADAETTYRIDQLWPVGGRVILAAQKKAGKSTLVGNLLRCLADGDKLLDTYATQQGSVVLIDNELDERTLRRWLREQGVKNPSAVRLLPLRGKTATFDLLDDQTRAEWARLIAGTDVVVLDCMRPVLDALGLSEDKEAGRFLVAFDALLDEAGVSEALVVHHMGHAGERARGDSRILDWPDAVWNMLKDAQPDGAHDRDVARYISAYGRDVDVAQQRLGYDPATRHLSIAGGSRRDVRVDDALAAVRKLLADAQQSFSKNGIEGAVAGAEHSRSDVRAAIQLGLDMKLLRFTKGGRGAHEIALNNP